ncbi:hypothetical protein [Amycolatopsis australiensis]|uniref:Uncharacterized protein n=1 Tax=Amycolatopsis australiensis TaxID=546364 RepID=A0A1K1S1Y3_9PSEU|nr:hypothetical protein [Amycolatopsis australiensis]SFW78318.1 hypothetical protein SAMN04489730_4496 [Amycolatopsis australiensis]
MKKAYVYGMAGLVTAAVGVTAASGLFDGAESSAGESQALAATTGATPKPAPVRQEAPPPAVRVVPAPVAEPAAQAVPVAKSAEHAPARKAKPVQRTHHKKADRPRPAVVRAAAVEHLGPRQAATAVRPIAIVVPPRPDPATIARQALDDAAQAVKNARRLVDDASAEVKRAKSDLEQFKHAKAEHGKHKAPAKKPKGKPAPVHKVKPVTTPKGSGTVSVSLDSSQVKPGQTRTVTKSTADGSAWSSVTVTRN